jgi:Dihydrouridine synthase (Dus).
MITSRALVERTPETMRMITPDAGDPVRSVQLYGVDPDTVAAAVRILGGGGVGRPRGPELRLPGPQGDAAGRRRGAPVEAGPVP